MNTVHRANSGGSRAQALGLVRRAVLFGACLSLACARVPEPAVVLGSLDASRLLAELATVAAGAGAAALLPIGALLVAEGEQLGSFVAVPDAQCLLAVARGEGGLRDVDLFVFDDAGVELTSDQGPARVSAAMLCPPHPRRVYVAARAMGGTGVLALGAMRVPAERASEVALATAARGLPGTDSGKLDAWPGLERTVREHREALGASFRDVRRLVLPLDPHAATRLGVELSARRCLDVLAVPSEEIDALELVVEDADGRIVARSRSAERAASAVVCSRAHAPLNVALRPRGGVGRVAVVVGEADEGAAVELGNKTWVDGLEPMLELAAARARHRLRVGDASGRAVELAVEAVAELSVPHASVLELEPGCTRVDVVGGAPLGSFAATAWSADDRLLAEGEGGEIATLFACQKERAPVRLEVVARERRGPYAIELRHESLPTPELVQNPLAAARLLARVEAALGPIAASLPSVVALSLGDGARHTRPFVLPKGECGQWLVAAAGEDALVLEARANDGTSLGVARGGRVVSLRACAAEAPLEGVVLVASGAPGGTLLLHELPARAMWQAPRGSPEP